MNHELSVQDLSILIEAVEAWENKDMAGDLMGDLLTGMMTDLRDPAKKAAYEADLKARTEKKKDERALRKEQSILLRAKLIQILNNTRNDELAKTFGLVS